MSAPSDAVTRSPKRKSLCTPRFTPQVPGPINRFRFGDLGIVKHVGAKGRKPQTHSDPKSDCRSDD